MYSFSPNMLKTYQSCPQKYYFKYIMNMSVPMKASIFEKGKKIHALANYYLQGCDITKLETALNKDEAITWMKLKSNEYFQKKSVQSEYNLSCKIQDFWIGGRLDAIVKDNEKLYILDYKTGSIPKNPEYDYQTMVYLLALDKYLKYKNNSSDICFVYIDLNNNISHKIEYDENKSLKYEQAIIDICTQIANFKQNDDIKHSKMCEYCEYNKFCL